MHFQMSPTENLLVMVAMFQIVFALAWATAYRLRVIEIETVRGFVLFNVVMCAALLMITFRGLYPGRWHKVFPLLLICVSTYALLRAIHKFFRKKFRWIAGRIPLVLGAIGIVFFVFVYFSDTLRLAAFLLVVLLAIVCSVVNVAPMYVREFGALQARILYAAVAFLSLPILWASYQALFTRQPIGLWESARLNDVSMFGLALGIIFPNLLFASFITMRYVNATKALQRKDHLTALLNHQTFHALCETDWRERCRTGSMAAALAIDIDQLKSINERYGHLVGDYVLATLAGLLRDVSGRRDVLARTSGKTFFVLHRAATPQSARALAAELRARIVKTRWTTLIGGPSSVTVGIGIAFDEPTDDKANDLLSRAERALRKGKRNGPDRITILDRGGHTEIKRRVVEISDWRNDRSMNAK